MNRVANGLTHTLQKTPNSTLHYGEVLEAETYVKVRWLWLVPTFMLALLTTLLLIITITLTSRYGVPVWKSSGLVYLFYGLDGWDKEELQVDSHRDMQKKAKGMSGHLKKNEAGYWRLVKS